MVHKEYHGHTGEQNCTFPGLSLRMQKMWNLSTVGLNMKINMTHMRWLQTLGRGVQSLTYVHRPCSISQGSETFICGWCDICRAGDSSISVSGPSYQQTEVKTLTNQSQLTCWPNYPGVGMAICRLSSPSSKKEASHDQKCARFFKRFRRFMGWYRKATVILQQHQTQQSNDTKERQ